MTIHDATFIGSFTRNEQAPKDELPEFAFIGRSNVGKSSLINMLTQRKDLARISNTPGKTQHLNYYRINDLWYLVDLPGYGYAQVSKKDRRQFSRMTQGFMQKRETLVNAFVLIDANIPPQRIDLEFCAWLGTHQIPFVLVFTKSDRPKPHELEQNIDAFRAAMLEEWEELPPQFVTSSRDNRGREELLGFIGQTLEQIGLRGEPATD